MQRIRSDQVWSWIKPILIHTPARGRYVAPFEMVCSRSWRKSRNYMWIKYLVSNE